MPQKRCALQERLIRALASGLGSGLLPFAPGTFGTLAAIPLALIFSTLNPWLGLALTLLFVPFAIIIAGRAAQAYGQKDPGWIVIDEAAGFLFASLWLNPSLFSYLAAFFLFRLFDILKPPPVGWLDRSLKGGSGIVLDDVAAGLMTRALLYPLEAFRLI